MSSNGRQSGRGYRLDNLDEGGKDLPPPAPKKRPKNDTTLMATDISIDEHYYNNHSERRMLGPGVKTPFSDS